MRCCLCCSACILYETCQMLRNAHSVLLSGRSSVSKASISTERTILRIQVMLCSLVSRFLDSPNTLPQLRVISGICVGNVLLGLPWENRCGFCSVHRL